jgi:nitrite reductase/ring-hydroxylating ferredoxin subunit
MREMGRDRHPELSFFDKQCTNRPHFSIEGNSLPKAPYIVHEVTDQGGVIMDWTPTVAADKLIEGKPVLFKQDPKQIVILMREDRLFVFDNRCPHEGYPLSEGTFSDEDGSCVLTCNWHNWKFTLDNGQNLFGDAHLRVYPAELRNGTVWVDLTEKPKDQIYEESLASLKAAFSNRSYDRIARILARLDFEDIDWRPALAETVIWTHDRLQYGMTHAFAAGAEWLVMHDYFATDRNQRLTCLTEFVDYLAYDSHRYVEPAYPYPKERKTYDPEAFTAAIEAEDESTAIGMLEDALSKGLGFPQLEEPLTEAALSHYQDFGHSLIYTVKAGQLIQQLGEKVQAPVLRSLVREMIYASREDLLPEFRRYAPSIEEARPLSIRETPSDAPLASPCGFSVNKTLQWVIESLHTHAPQQVYTMLVEAAAKNLLTFDTRFGEHTHLPVAKNASWLTVTHAVTFANAVRLQCTRFPRFWKQGLLQIACFTGRAAVFLDRNLESHAWFVDNADDFFHQAKLNFLDHGIALPIYPAHYLKTALAVEEELPHLPARVGETLVAGLNRFLSSPIKQKHGLRLVNQAIALVGRDYRSG